MVPDTLVRVTHVISFVVRFDQRVFGSSEVEQRTFQTCLLAVVPDSSLLWLSSSLSLFLVFILSSTNPPLPVLSWSSRLHHHCLDYQCFQMRHLCDEKSNTFPVTLWTYLEGALCIKTLEISTKMMTKGFSLILSINQSLYYCVIPTLVSGPQLSDPYNIHIQTESIKVHVCFISEVSFKTF